MMTGDDKSYKISDRNRENLKNNELIKEKLDAGISVQEILGFSEEVLVKFYLAATRFVEQKRFADAANSFLFLVALNPYHYDYWLGFGSASQQCGEYEAAINAYEMAAVCEIDNPLPYFYLAKCLFAMHERESALSAIDLAIEYAGEQQENEELYEQALAAKEVILKEKEK